MTKAVAVNPFDLGEFTEEHKIYETTFENEYTGKIHYKQFNLRKKVLKGIEKMECGG